MTSWQKLMKTFDLEQQVSAFVKEQVKALVAEGRHDFEFRGSFCRSCELNNVPHPPHVHDHYRTVRYGTLENFCIGQPGQIPGQGQLHIVIAEHTHGSAECPGSAAGYWFIGDQLEGNEPSAA